MSFLKSSQLITESLANIEAFTLPVFKTVAQGNGQKRDKGVKLICIFRPDFGPKRHLSSPNKYLNHLNVEAQI